jgi:heptosyltransferase-2
VRPTSLPAPDGVRSIQVIRLSALGDVLLCEPAVRALAAHYPNARVTVVTRAQYADLYAAHPAVSEVLTPQQARAAPPPDLALDLQNKLETRWLAARARWSAAWRKRDAAGFWRAIRGRPLHVGYRGGPHQVERIGAWLGLPTQRAPQLHRRPAWADVVDQLPSTDAGARSWGAVLLPGASRSVKAWGTDRFAAVADRLTAWGVRVSVLGGPGEDAVVRAAAGAAGHALPTNLPVGPAAEVLARADVAIGNDSGLAHVAMAVGTPAVILFGPTPPGRWGPPLGGGVVVSADPPCGPCSDHGNRPCQRPRRFCLDDLPASAVTDVLRFDAETGRVLIRE